MIPNTLPIQKYAPNSHEKLNVDLNNSEFRNRPRRSLGYRNCRNACLLAGHGDVQSFQGRTPPSTRGSLNATMIANNNTDNKCVGLFRTERYLAPARVISNHYLSGCGITTHNYISRTRTIGRPTRDIIGTAQSPTQSAPMRRGPRSPKSDRRKRRSPTQTMANVTHADQSKKRSDNDNRCDCYSNHNKPMQSGDCTSGYLSGVLERAELREGLVFRARGVDQ